MGFLQKFLSKREFKRLETEFQDSPSPGIALDLAKIYEDEGDVMGALQVMRKARKRFPKAPEIKDAFERLSIEERRFEKADLKKKLTSQPSPILYSRLATILTEDDELDDAEKLCAKSLKEYPSYGGAYQILGDIAFKRKKREEAITNYEKALDLNKNNFQVLKKLSQLYLDIGSVNKAIENLKSILKFNPGDKVIEEMLQLAEERLSNPTIRLDKIGADDDDDAILDDEAAPDSVSDEAASETMTAELFLNIQDETGNVRVVPVRKNLFKIGRSPENDLVLDDKKHFVSREHAHIIFEHGTFAVMDNASGNGTFLNGKRLKRAVLKNDDTIMIGTFKLQVSLGSEGDPEKTILGFSSEDPERTVMTTSPPADAPPVVGGGGEESVGDTANRIASIQGVSDVVLVNSSGFVIASSVSGEFDEVSLGAAVTQISKVISTGSFIVDKIGQTKTAIVDCENMEIFVTIHSQFTLAVFAESGCKRGLIQLEMEKIFTKI